MKKMKRLLAVLLSLVFMVSAVQMASALIVADGTCGRTITWTLDSQGNLVINGAGNIPTYTQAAQSYRSHIAKIKTVTIKGNILGIAKQAFHSMTEMKSVSIKSETQTIYSSVFASCPVLTSVELPEGLLKLESKVFEGCKALPEIVLPSTVQTLGNDLFQNCSALKTITVLSKTVIFPNSLFSPKTTAIKGYVGSTAETYAKTYGLTFIPLEGAAPTQPSGETTTPAAQTPTTPAAQSGEQCPLCGQIHAGFPDNILGFLHKAIYVVVKLFGL